MSLNIRKEVDRLVGMSVPELRRKHAQVTGEATKSRHKQFLIRKIAWRLQANAEGDLSERARARAMELAKDADVRITAPRRGPARTGMASARGTLHISQDDRLPMPGAIIVREYKGQVFEVKILPRGFEFEGEIFRTLSAVAKAITGKHWNGYHFFGLKAVDRRLKAVDRRL